MKLNSTDALNILNRCRGKLRSDHWIEHSICVGETVAVIADALGLDSEKVRAFGYIHDIGKQFSEVNDEALTHGIKRIF